jgi:hypothetical protein
LGNTNYTIKPTINNTKYYTENQRLDNKTTLKTQDKVHKILHRKLTIGQHEPHLKPTINNTTYYTENY